MVAIVSGVCILARRHAPGHAAVWYRSSRTSGAGSAALPVVTWKDERGRKHGAPDAPQFSAELRSSRLVVPDTSNKTAYAVDQTMSTDRCNDMLRKGSYLVWKGTTYQGAARLQSALLSRNKVPEIARGTELKKAFILERRNRSRLLATMDALLIHFEEHYRPSVPLAPDNLADACEAAFGPRDAARPLLISLQQLRGVVGAYELCKKGVDVPVQAPSSAEMPVLPFLS